jgi:AcrR family transcriptional regulator
LAEQNTKERILDSAEYLFANKGLKDTSVRDITSQADVHLAVVNYHFQSKDGLVKAVMERRIATLSRQRLELLDTFEQKFESGSVPIEYVLYALLYPGIKMCFDKPHFLKIAGQIVSHPDEETFIIFVSHFEDVFSRFKEAFAVSLPHISEEELMWRIHFLIGSMIHTWTNHSWLKTLSCGVCELREQDKIINMLIAFCAAGLRAQEYIHPLQRDELSIEEKTDPN